MRKQFLSSLLLGLLLVSSALATEKLPDVKDGVMENGSRIAIAGTLDGSSPIFNRPLDPVLPPATACDFPLVDSASDGQYYAVICITSTNDNPVEIIVDAAGTTLDDTHMELYCDPFDPNAPLTNAVFSDDDDGVGFYSAFLATDNVVLTPSAAYYLVLTTFSAGDIGNFLINTSTNVVFCEGVATESTTWSKIKAMHD